MTTAFLALLVGPVTLATSGAAVYTCPTQTTARISRAVFTNISGSSATITVGISSDGSLSSAQYMIDGQSISSGATYVSPELAALTMPAGYSLFAYASASSSINLTVSGIIIQ